MDYQKSKYQKDERPNGQKAKMKKDLMDKMTNKRPNWTK